MTPDEAEAILALASEVAVGVELASDEAAFRADWRVRYAAERVVERIFQAAEGLPEELRERYFGDRGFRALRGMRNRLAHNYLDIDADILWESISVDLRAVRGRVAREAHEARSLIDGLLVEQDVGSDEWDRRHLGVVAPTDSE